MRVSAVVLISLVCAGGGLMGQMGPIESLVERSPFLPPGYNESRRPEIKPRPVPTVPVASSRMELVGVAADEGVVSVSLRLRGETRGTWLGPGETLEGVRFVRFDVSNRQAVVDNSGRREVIPLKAPSVSPIPEQPANPPRNSGPAPARNVSQPDNTKKRTVQVPVRRTFIAPKQ